MTGGRGRALAAPRWRGARLRRLDALAVEIAAVLVVKAALLWLLWWACFSDPLARGMHVAPALMERQLLHAAAAEAPDDRP